MAIGAGSAVGFAPTADLDRARAFYEGVLGLTVVHADDYGIDLALDGGGALRLVKPPQFTPFPFTLFGFAVSDIAAEVRTLAGRGVTFERFMPTQDEDNIWAAPGGSKVAWFKDPDGNLLSLSQSAEP